MTDSLSVPLSTDPLPLPLTLSLHSPRESLVSLCRQICVLQARGQTAAATQLADEQMASLKAATALTDQELQALFEAEKERVANASVLAEMLLPSLTALLSASKLVDSKPVNDALRADRSTASDGNSPIPFPRPAVGIADFIEEMLGQERHPRPARGDFR